MIDLSHELNTFSNLMIIENTQAEERLQLFFKQISK
jgi:hypothetical protein